MIDLTGFKINIELTSKYRPIEGACNNCGNMKNFIVYENEESSEFVAGCCLCGNYGELQSSPFNAAIDWVKRFGVCEKRF